MRIFRPTVKAYMFVVAFCGFWWIWGLLYSARLVGIWSPFGPIERWDFFSSSVWLVNGFFLIGHIAMVARCFATIVITDEGIAYQWVFSKILTWKEVIRVRAGAKKIWQPRELTIWTADSRWVVPNDFYMSELNAFVLEMARKHSPNCVIEDQGARNIAEQAK